MVCSITGIDWMAVTQELAGFAMVLFMLVIIAILVFAIAFAVKKMIDEMRG